MRRRPHPPAREADGRMLASRQLVALTFDRHPSLVNRVVPGVACDVATRVILVDVDEAEQLLAAMGRRTRSR